MDCEKFENTLLDELYDELDEVTGAAAKRHVAGCARCAALFSGLKATRRVAVLPLVDPPPGLEDRILAAANEAQKVVPIRRRVSNVISLAGSWAMRPQTAMAALFLLMIGSSALLIKGKVARPVSSTLIVSEQGEPEASAASTLAPGPVARAASDGVLAVGGAASGGGPAATAAASPAAEGAVARARPKSAPDPDRVLKRAIADETGEPARDSYGSGAQPSLQSESKVHTASGAGVAQAPAAAPVPPPMAPRPAPAPASKAAPLSLDSDDSNGAGGAAPPGDVDAAMTAYKAGDYATAARLWGDQARGGDMNAALWEARSVRESSGCGAAAPKFDRVAQQAGFTVTAYDAMFDAAKCYRALGQYDAARARLNQLLLVPSYINRAQNELNAMGPKASKARAPAAATAPATPNAAAAPPPAAAAPQTPANQY